MSSGGRSVPCPACGCGRAVTVALDHPLFRHLDFSLLHPGPAELGSCPECGAVFRQASADDLAAINSIYASHDYVAGRRAGHSVFVPALGRVVSQHYLQAELLEPVLSPTAAVLDVGCHDGGLLHELRGRRPRARLCGFDVTDENRVLFPPNGDYEFHSGDLAAVSGPFDVIVFSHSLQYIRDFAGLAAVLKRLLAPGGRVFVQAPDFSAKACSLLFGDTHYHYTAAILAAMFARHGMRWSPVANDYFPRDAVGFVEVGPVDAVYPGDGPLRVAVARLDDLAEGLRAIEAGSLAVLGTTVEAAFAAATLGERIQLFVDENEECQGLSFAGRPVRHPATLSADDVTVLPYGASAEAIGQRFRTAYPGHYICL